MLCDCTLLVSFHSIDKWPKLIYQVLAASQVISRFPCWFPFNFVELTAILQIKTGFYMKSISQSLFLDSAKILYGHKILTFKMYIFTGLHTDFFEPYQTKNCKTKLTKCWVGIKNCLTNFCQNVWNSRIIISVNFTPLTIHTHTIINYLTFGCHLKFRSSL